MRHAVADLTEKQCETLRLIGRGHDAKSCARALGLSVHTINERLRDARRALGVSSSREAARMLLAHERSAPESLGDNDLGDAVARGAADPGAARNAGQGDGRRMRRTLFVAFGVIAMSILAALAFALSTPAGQAPAADTANADNQATSQDAALEAAARRWLEQGEAGDYSGSYAATADSFRQANTLAVWQAAASGLRERFGPAVSRRLLSVESVPTPPDGNEIVVFQTRFAKGGEKIETVALVREAGAWKVVGAYVE